MKAVKFFSYEDEMKDVKMNISHQSNGAAKRSNKPFSEMKSGKFRKLFNRHDRSGGKSESLIF